MTLAVYQFLTPVLALLMVARAIWQVIGGRRTAAGLVWELVFWGVITALAVRPHLFVDNFEAFTGLRAGLVGGVSFVVLVLGMLVLYLLHENRRRADEIAELSRLLARKKREE